MEGDLFNIDINFEGLPGKSIFQHLVQECVTEEDTNRVRAQTDSTVEHVKRHNDDRLLVLVGALLIENAIDALLEAFVPGYKTLKANKDFTFSMRIELASRLQLIPSHIFNSAHCVRDIRNRFAHDLQINSFSALGEGKCQAVHSHLRAFNVDPGSDWSEADKFGHLIIVTTMALNLYLSHVQWLNEYTRSESFMKQFADYCTARRAGKLENITYQWKNNVKREQPRDKKPNDAKQDLVPVVLQFRELDNTYNLNYEFIDKPRPDDKEIDYITLYKPTGEIIDTVHNLICKCWNNDTFPQEPGQYKDLQVISEPVSIMADGELYPVAIKASIAVKEILYFSYQRDEDINEEKILTAMNSENFNKQWTIIDSISNAPVAPTYKLIVYRYIPTN